MPLLDDVPHRLRRRASHPAARRRNKSIRTPDAATEGRVSMKGTGTGHRA
ncbi:MAG TPA: hypothetical protein VNL91_01955 [Thermoanaerobaculia bacterium]|nr:hypothetical protein [Thermoanaerobaculia bacterium]